jgi:Flp pilus assembly protein TadD
MQRMVVSVALAALGAALAACQDTASQTIQGTLDQTLRQSGAQAARAGDWREAAISYRGVYERNPNDLTAALGLIRSLRQLGRADEAAQVGAEAVGRAPDDPKLLAEYGKARLAAHDLDGALTTLRAAVAQAPNDWTLFSAIGIAEDVKGTHGAAQESYLKALALSPSNATVMNNLALSLALSGNIDAGIQKLQELTSPMRGSPQARQSLALLYAMKGDLAKTERLVRGDLPDKSAAENMAYYRLLGSGRETP